MDFPPPKQLAKNADTARRNMGRRDFARILLTTIGPLQKKSYFCTMRFFQKYTPGNRELNPALLWDYDVNNIDPLKCRRLIATRVIKIGGLEDFYAAFDIFGGIEEFAKIAKNEVIGLSPKELNFICYAFNLKKQQTQCYKKAQLRKAHLNF